MSTYHARQTASTLRDAANFVMEQSQMIESLEFERRAIQRLREALVKIATSSQDLGSREIAKHALRPSEARANLRQVPLAPVVNIPLRAVQDVTP